jgi:hypothetical protein
VPCSRARMDNRGRMNHSTESRKCEKASESKR